MRQLALLLASLSLAACETGTSDQVPSTLSLSPNHEALEGPIGEDLVVMDFEDESKLLDQLDRVLQRNDIAPADRAALTEITALLQETN